MRRRLPLVLGLVLLLPAVARPAAAQVDAELLAALRAGGKVVYLAHAEVAENALPEPTKELPERFRSCSDPRMSLTAEGVRAAFYIGWAMKRLDVPRGPVLAGPACRHVETAWYAFRYMRVSEGLAPMDAELAGLSPDARASALRKLLANPPPEGKNVYATGDAANLEAAADVTLAPAEAAVFAPDGEGGYTLLGRAGAADWEASMPAR